MNRELSYAEQNNGCEDTTLPTGEDRFATEPAIAAQTIYHRLDEETLHTLFEQAISDRLEAVSERLRLRSGPFSNETSRASARRGYLQKVGMSSFPMQQHSGIGWWLWLDQMWQRRVIFVSLMLMLVMAGFDLMGILALRLH